MRHSKPIVLGVLSFLCITLIGALINIVTGRLPPEMPYLDYALPALVVAILVGVGLYVWQELTKHHAKPATDGSQADGARPDAPDGQAHLPIDPTVLVDAQQLLDTLPLPPKNLPEIAPLPAGLLMPQPRNELFVNREKDLQMLACALKPGGIAAITGLAGIGKTQLAVEFAHRYGQYFMGGVFWLSFEKPAGVRVAVAQYGGARGLALHPDFANLPLDDQVALVQTAWQSPLPRLLIFDNCEDEALLKVWRPTTGRCRVLLTSRRHNWDPSLGIQMHALDILPRAESIALLCKFRPDLAKDDPDLATIAAELGDLPLALHLAGSYLNHYRAAITPATYLAQLHDPTLLQHPSLRSVGFSPTGHDLNVARTFALIYKQLDPGDSIDILAMRLLVRAAYLVPGHPIPRKLLVETLNLPTDDSDTRFKVEDALRKLIDLGLIETRSDDVLQLHRLLAIFVRGQPAPLLDRLLAIFVRGQASDVATREAVETAVYQFANQLIEEKQRAPLLAIQAHLRAVTDTAKVRDDQQAAQLCNAMGDFLELISDYGSARPYYDRALAITERALGYDHPDTATNLDDLGVLLMAQGELTAARPYLERALKIRERVLKPDDLNTVHSLNNLGGLHYRLGTLNNCQGDLLVAYDYYERARTITEHAQGLNHRNTALVLNHLGAVLRALGNPSAARDYYERALAIRERVLGPNDPQTAQSLNSLALLLRDQKELIPARRYFKRALAITEQAEGPDHPHTAQLLHNLGALLQAQSKLPTACRYFKRALAIRRRVLGPKHYDTVDSLIKMGEVLQALDELAQARSCYEQALDILMHTFGPDHSTTRIVRANLDALTAVIHATPDRSPEA